MSTTYLQESRFLFVETPLGPNKLLLESYTGREAISELFSFQLELLSEDQKIDFAGILGNKISFGVAGLDGTTRRYIQGIVTAFAQLPSRERVARYRATVSPGIWKLTRKRQSRIFQHLAVPDILRAVLQGFDVDYDLRRTYDPREYCVQYRESDFEFISRLMEEEGIFYFFKQAGDGDKLILADTPVSHTDVPGDSSIVYDEVAGGLRDELRIFDWQKTQGWDSGKYTLRDACFELPHNNLQADQEILPDVQVGKITHKLNLGGNASEMEVYDYPGGYAKHVECGDGGKVSQIFDENKRAAGSGMERIEAAQFVIRGQSNVYDFIPGYRFTLERHFNGDGQYVITSVTHSATEGSFYSGAGNDQGQHFSNIFTCLPFALPFRPPCATPKPQVRGCQTAYVVGPSGEEIYTDKYGRIKVQFHWDRDGKSDDQSSCWVRVASIWAGKGWGAIHLPRIGQEVVVDFLEGDPDRPIVVGSAYNAENMPPYSLPDDQTLSGVKSRSSKDGGSENCSEIVIEDKKGSEYIRIHAEKDMRQYVEKDSYEYVGNDRHLVVDGSQAEKVGGDKHLTVQGEQREAIQGNLSQQVGGSHNTKVGSVYTVESGQEVHIKGGMKVIIEAGMQISLIGPGGFVDIGPAGVTIQGTMVLINSGGSHGSGTASQPSQPKEPKKAEA
jgi:type VI secretion system secreted protein VgrG